MEKEIGKIGWIDLSVPNADELLPFYNAVVGWEHEAVPMRDGDTKYADYTVKPPGGEVVSGICNARGYNAKMPAAWMIYVTVADVEAAARACVDGGGAIVDGPKPMGEGVQVAVLRDPAGAVFAVID